MDIDDKTKQKYQNAVKSLGKLRDMREQLSRRKDQATSKFDHELVSRAEDMLKKIETRVSTMMSRARKATREIEVASRQMTLIQKGSSRKSKQERGLGDIVGGLGSLVGKMGQAVVDTSGTVVSLAGKTGASVVQSSVEIAKSAVPITKRVLNTALDVANTTYKSSNNVANTIKKSITDTAASMTIAAQNTSSSLLNQTSNLVSSLTDVATSTVGKIGGMTTQSASNIVNSILNPDSGHGVKSLVQSAGEKASGLLEKSSGMVSSLFDELTPKTNGILESANSAVGNMVKSSCSLANTLTGFTGGAVDSIASGLTSAIKGGGNNIGQLVDSAFSGAGKGLIGLAKTGADAISSGAATASGLFGSAIGLACDAASSTTGTAFDTAKSLVGGLASGVGGLTGGLSGLVEKTSGTATDIVSGLGGGLTGLAGSLLGGVSDVAGQLADVGTDVASGLLSSATELGGSLLDSATGLAGDLLSTGADVGGSLLDAVGDIAGNVGDLAGDALGGLSDLAGGALDAATDLAGDALDVAGDLAGGVLDAASDLAGDALDLASDVADGVIDAAGAVVDDLADAAMDAVEEIGDAIDEAFDDMDDECEEMEDEYDEDEWEDDWEDEEVEDEEFDDEDFVDEEDMEENWDEEYEDNYDYDYDYEGTPENPEDPGEEQDEEWNDDWGEEPENEEEENQMGNEQEQNESVEAQGGENKVEVSWKTTKNNPPSDLLFMIHDGDQQMFNPYGHTTGDWTMYSFRPDDAKLAWPQIAITPSSFKAISSMDEMLNNIPYIVIKEYFFKNTASTMINFVQKIFKLAGQASGKIKEESNNGAEEAKTSGGSLLDKVQELFYEVGPEEIVIDIPYALYCGLRTKVYGNTYIFPYIVNSSTSINKASNDSEWGNGDGEGAIGKLKGALEGAVRLIGGFAANLLGSQVRPAELFPAPSWTGGQGQKAEFSFDLMLINDHVIKARNNYMCVNTIIHNNLAIQKAIVQFPGALYEIWLPTGQRHLMCTGSFDLFPLGLNRKVPERFFNGGEVPGANFEIGTSTKMATMKNFHSEKAEVIPDAYKLTVKFTSCLKGNMNTSVFQYYVKMAGYDAYSTTNMGGSEQEASPLNLLPGVQASEQDVENVTQEEGQEGGVTAPPGNNATTPTTGEAKRRVVDGGFRTSIQKRDDDLDKIDEKFYEATYNKSLEKLKSQFGDINMNSESAVLVVKRAQGVIRESLKFLERLYGAKDRNLWYKQDQDEELYTTIKPDYRKMLRKQYARGFQELRDTIKEIDIQNGELVHVDQELASRTSLDGRNPILERKVQVQRRIAELQKRKREIEDDLLQKDSDLVQAAWDEHDRAVTAKKREITPRIFQQVWNEKIMNAYERDKLQYLTSQEKTRYFNDKIRELKKFDTYGVLNHPDWFFRVAVLDFIVSEMQRLVYWFKNCSYDDFETVYKIVRKLNLLHLDIDCIRSNGEFNVNKTNLFYMSEQDAKDYKKIDDMLVGNTLYELFKSQVRLNFVRYDNDGESDNNKDTAHPVDKELVVEREHEIQIDNQRTVRQDIVARYWGSEEQLTRIAYKDVMSDTKQLEDDKKPSVEFLDSESGDMVNKTFDTLAEFKDRIIELKLKGDGLSGTENNELKELVGSLSNVVNAKKETYVMQKMQEMVSAKGEELGREKTQIESRVV